MSAKGEADRLELLAQTCEMLNEVRWGHKAFTDRLAEMGDGGLPSGEGNGRSGGHSSPVERQLVPEGGEKGKVYSRHVDPAALELREFEHELRKAWKAATILHQRYTRIATPQSSPTKMTDPGCELCDQIPNHWCPTYVSIEVETSAKKGKAMKRKLRVCWWCYRHFKAAEAIPTIEQRTAHAEGRRVPLKAS